MKNYLLVAAMPTPNGGLHLGHLGSQYLPLDIFKRYQKLNGNQVAYYGGFDVYDNAISVVAKRTGHSPEDTARRFQGIITQELAYFSIDIDTLINYLDQGIVQKSLDTVKAFTFNNRQYFTKKKICYPETPTGLPISGNWLSGRCKICNAPTKGYACDACGISVTPGDLLDVKLEGQLAGTTVQWKPKFIDFLSLPTAPLRDYINAQANSEDWVGQLHHQLSRQTFELQWTSVDEWGLSLPGPEKNSVFFNRNFSFIEQILLNDIYSTQHGHYAFDRDSSVETIIAYGKDNAGLLLCDLPCLAITTDWVKPYKRHWVSHYYCIDGRKMSTSQNFAIWLSHLIKDRVEPNAVRLYLCRQHAYDTDQDLSLEGLLSIERQYHELCEVIERLIQIPAQPETSVPSPNAWAEIDGQVAELFRQPKLNLARYYQYLSIFQRLGTGIKTHQEARQWLFLFEKNFSALVPGLI